MIESYVTTELPGNSERANYLDGVGGFIQALYPDSATGNYTIQFDGINDLVKISPSPSLVMSDAITIEAWVYYYGRGTTQNYNVIIDKGAEY